MADDNMAGDSSLVLRHATAGDMPRIEPLWKALYQHQFEHGMLLRLPEGAYDAWLKSVVPFLGRFASVVVAARNGELIGFVAGRVRTLPPYFGSASVGAISEVFVSESHRGGGLGRRLLAFSLEWYQAQQITRVELQVVAGNPDGIRFYRQLGWHEELIQMVWDTSQHQASDALAFGNRPT